jgi:hypothetical protein
MVLYVIDPSGLSALPIIHGADQSFGLMNVVDDNGMLVQNFNESYI